MTLFVPYPSPFRSLTGVVIRRTCQKARYCPTTAPKRLRMSASDRFEEFSLNSSSHRSDSPDVTQIVDWDQWSVSGKPMTIPALVFPPTQVFLPGELKQLHLFEAKYLALFETVVIDYQKKCAHVLVDPARHAMAAFGAIIAVKNWRRLEVGVSVDFEAVGRLKASEMKHQDPFWRCDFHAVEDDPMEPTECHLASELEKRFWSAFRQVITICIKLGEDPIREKIDTASATIEATMSKPGTVPDRQSGTIAGDNKLFFLSPDAKRELYLQKVKQAAKRAVNYEDIDFASEEVDHIMQARRARGLSFAGWDFFPSGPGHRQKALEQRNTVTRLATVVQSLEEHSRRLAAQLALRDALREE